MSNPDPQPSKIRRSPFETEPEFSDSFVLSIIAFLLGVAAFLFFAFAVKAHEDSATAGNVWIVFLVVAIAATLGTIAFLIGAFLAREK